MNLFDKKFVYLEWDDVLEGKVVVAGDTLAEIKEKFLKELFSSVVKGNGYYPFLSSTGTRCAMAYYDPNYSCKRAYVQGKVIQCRHNKLETWSDCTVPPSWYDAYEYRVKPEGSDSCLLILNDHNEVGIVKEGRDWKGLLIKKGTEEECANYVLENYCGKCVHRLSLRCGAFSGCQGFKPSAIRRRMTNRELARWLAKGNGQAWDGYSGRDLTQYVYEHDRDNEPCDTAVSIRTWDGNAWSEPLVEEQNKELEK